MTHPKRANTELKLVRLVIATDLCPKIILSPELSVLKTVPHGHRYNANDIRKVHMKNMKLLSRLVLADCADYC